MAGDAHSVASSPAKGGGGGGGAAPTTAPGPAHMAGDSSHAHGSPSGSPSGSTPLPPSRGEAAAVAGADAPTVPVEGGAHVPLPTKPVDAAHALLALPVRARARSACSASSLSHGTRVTAPGSYSHSGLPVRTSLAWYTVGMAGLNQPPAAGSRSARVSRCADTAEVGASPASPSAPPPPAGGCSSAVSRAASSASSALSSSAAALTAAARAGTPTPPLAAGGTRGKPARQWHGWGRLGVAGCSQPPSGGAGSAVSGGAYTAARSSLLTTVVVVATAVAHAAPPALPWLLLLLLLLTGSPGGLAVDTTDAVATAPPTAPSSSRPPVAARSSVARKAA